MLVQRSLSAEANLLILLANGILMTHRLKGDRDEGKAKRWLTFLNNHRQVITAFDFFTVPTLTFRVLYCFFVIEHGRRRILHFNTTAHPTSDWIVQQLREGFPATVCQLSLPFGSLRGEVRLLGGW
jgi:hypothetical protein